MLMFTKLLVATENTVHSTEDTQNNAETTILLLSRLLKDAVSAMVV